MPSSNTSGNGGVITIAKNHQTDNEDSLEGKDDTPGGVTQGASGEKGEYTHEDRTKFGETLQTEKPREGELHGIES